MSARVCVRVRVRAVSFEQSIGGIDTEDASVVPSGELVRFARTLLGVVCLDAAATPASASTCVHTLTHSRRFIALQWRHACCNRCFIRCVLVSCGCLPNTDAPTPVQLSFLLETNRMFVVRNVSIADDMDDSVTFTAAMQSSVRAATRGKGNVRLLQLLAEVEVRAASFRGHVRRAVLLYAVYCTVWTAAYGTALGSIEGCYF